MECLFSFSLSLLRLQWLLPLLFLIRLFKIVVVVIDQSLCLAAFTVFVNTYCCRRLRWENFLPLA